MLFDGFQANLDDSAGTIRLTLYRTGGPIFGLGGGSLARIAFHIKATALPGKAIINLQQSINGTETALHASDTAGIALGNFNLQPAPSDTADDSLDGSITVQALSTVSLTSSLNPAAAGPAITFTAVVSSGWSVVSGQEPSGTVTFVDGSSTLGTSALNSMRGSYVDRDRAGRGGPSNPSRLWRRQQLRR